MKRRLASQTEQESYTKVPSIFVLGCLLLLCTLSSCSPYSKDAYMKKYQEFISTTQKNYKKYTENDWEKANSEYERFTGEWYKKFENDFTWKEELTLKKYKLQYNLIVAHKASSDFLNNLSVDGESFNKLEELIKNYSKDEMSEDIDFILEKAKELGEAGIETATEFLKEIKAKE